MNDTRIKIILNDARNFLQTTDEKYDVITSDPSPHSISAASSHLLTKEFFELVSSRLTKDGLFVCTLRGAGLSKTDFKTELKTFSEVFPNVLVWVSDVKALQDSNMPVAPILVGSKKAVRIDANEISGRIDANEKIRADLEKISIYSAHDFVSLMVLNESQVEKLVAAEDGQNTDDWPVIEFTAPANLFYNEYLKLSDILQTHEGSIR